MYTIIPVIFITACIAFVSAMISAIIREIFWKREKIWDIFNNIARITGGASVILWAGFVTMWAIEIVRFYH